MQLLKFENGSVRSAYTLLACDYLSMLQLKWIIGVKGARTFTNNLKKQDKDVDRWLHSIILYGM